MEMISIKNVTKRYGAKTVYENFNLDIDQSIGSYTFDAAENGE